MKIIEYLKNINIFLVVLDILFLIVSFLFLNKRKCSEKRKDLFVVIYTLINVLLFSYLNNIFQSIFTLKYLSVKLYLGVLVISLIIFLFTFNFSKKITLKYKVCNYLMVFILHIILVFDVYIVVSEKLEILNLIDIKNSITLMNLSLIIFFSYIGVLMLIYILEYLYQTKTKDNKKTIKNKKMDLNKTLLELSKYKEGESFYINGVDCSIIFSDDNKENIIKNYNILYNDIEGCLTNGYTLKENIMIKSICQKLKVNNFDNIDLSNFNILNKIEVDEYKFLKKIINNDL